MKLRLKTLTLLTIAVTLLTAAIPSGYYDSASGLSGTTLRQELHDIIDNHTVLSYDDVWDAFETTDVKANGKIWDMYTGTEWTFRTDQQGYDGDMDVYTNYNREHSWPKSWANETSPHYTDLFHLYPVQAYANSHRSNLPFGEVASGQETYTSDNGTIKGPARSGLGYTGTVFEPIDDFKGDFARTYFYISARYYGEDSAWDDVEMASGCELEEWAIDMLLDWHDLDPVSTKETDRNDEVYTLQGNRNPFIDHPEYVDSIWTSSTSTLNTPTANAASSIQSDGFTANWSSVAGASGYNLYVSTTNTFSSHVSGYGPKDAGSNLSDAISSLSSSTDYYYRVKAYNASSSSDYSNTISVTTSSIDSPTAQSATSVSHDRFTANWSSVTGATGYKLYVSEYADFGSYISGYGPNDVGNVTTLEITGLSSSTTYYYRLTAYDASDESGNSNSIELTTTAVGSPSNGTIFISEYIEGSSYNKALELYNISGSGIDLSNVTIKLYANGGSSPSATTSFSGTLNDGEVYVLAHSSANASILAEADYTNGGGIVNFNGNDVVELYYNDSLVDIMGQVGSSSDFAKDVTLVRKADITEGNSVYSSSEWDSYASDTFSYLGSHTVNEQALPITLRSFTAEFNQGTVTLNWITASETENAAFLIFRNEVLIANVQGAGTSTSIQSYVYKDANIIAGNVYTYHIEDLDYAGNVISHRDMAISIAVPEEEVMISDLLGDVFPNPFNPITNLPLTLRQDSHVEIYLHDLRGQQLKSVYKQKLKAGEHLITMDLNAFSSAIYLLRVQIGQTRHIQKLILAK